MEPSNRPRKACINCHQRKVRCNFSTGSGRCARCEQQDLDCILRDGASGAPRPSNRDVLQDLSSRLSNLEGIIGASAGENLSPVRPAMSTPIADWASGPGPSQDQHPMIGDAGGGLEGPVQSSSDSSSSIVQVYRGDISPWTHLVNSTATDIGLSTPQSADNFRVAVHRLADEDRSLGLSGGPAYFNLLANFPDLHENDVFRYTQAYADTIPYSIIHWPSLKRTTELLLQTNHVSRWGQVACILLYMAFGCAHLQTKESSVSSKAESGLYFNRAWILIPQLLMDHDLWAFKAMTLMVHYLQASSTPEPSWSLISTASRMGISLGFDSSKKPLTSNSFSSIELEEGKRTWWLCFVMERTISLCLGRPVSILKPPDLEHAALFPLENDSTLRSDQDADLESVQFFNNMIDLSLRRDSLLTTTNPPPTLLEIQSFLEQLLPDRAEPLLSYDPASIRGLRQTILHLSHYNAIQIVDTHFHPRRSPTSKSVFAARESLKIFTETQSDGKTMCLWMWLYYAFTSCVILFLSILHRLSLQSTHTTMTSPSDYDYDPDSILLDLSLISDLQALCSSLAEFSPGARRISEITTEMGKVGFELMKRRAKAKKRGRESVGGGGNLGDDDRGEGQHDTDQDGRAGKSRRTYVEPSTIEGQHPEATSSEDVPQNADAENVMGSVPVGFRWDEWDQWLEDFALT